MTEPTAKYLVNALIGLTVLLLAAFAVNSYALAGGPQVVVGPSGALTVVIPPPAPGGASTIISPSGDLTHIFIPPGGGIGQIIYPNGDLGFILPPVAPSSAVPAPTYSVPGCYGAC